MFEHCIANGRVVSDSEVRSANVYISDGKIQAVLPQAETAEAASVYDATGKFVLPGLVDAHVHFRDPGMEYKEGFTNGSLAAAVGGVTTVVIMPTDNPMTDSSRLIKEKIGLGDNSYVDFVLNAILRRNDNDIDGLLSSGACSLEIFFADVPSEYCVQDPRDLLALLAAAKGSGCVVGITPMVRAIVEPLQNELVQQGKNTPSDFAATRPPVAESIGIAIACEAALATGCRIHIRQVSSLESVATLAGYKERAPNLITAETLPHNLFLTDSDLFRLGHLAKMAPPLRHKSHNEALLQGLKRGTIDIVVTDHAPHLLEEKEAGRDNIWQAASGMPGVETLLPIMLRTYRNGDLSLPELVRVLSTRPAEIFGLYPQKGCIAQGSDADLLVVDMDPSYQIESRLMKSKAKYTAFEGLEGVGKIELVMLRGKTIVADGCVTGSPSGQVVRV